ncbi:DNA topoisomerase (ATP-hydrolyzing) [Sporobolomyces koalae]|uniref:DNA topoisomerase (ATP-hydrolyzing) n=1 Tax=Sporobolomyces koalae TaxID=500713 RepID=UPI00318220CB
MAPARVLKTSTARYEAPSLPSSPLSLRSHRLATDLDLIVLHVVQPQLSSAEKRLAIIDSLQRVALDVQKQIVSCVRALTAPSHLNEASLAIENSRNERVSVRIQLVRRAGRRNDPISQQLLTFPRRLGKAENTRMGALELATFLRVVELVLDGLIENVVSTKRDLYYRDVALFKNQQTVDTILEDLSATLQVRRSDLNVIATSKGLFSGALQLVMEDGTEKSGSLEGTLVPPGPTIARFQAGGAAWVLVVEKDAVFQTLSSVDWSSVDARIGHGILVTGKGYPDVATRELVKRLSDGLPSSTPIMFLVDSDPYGMDILATYVLGSAAMSHDAANLTLDIDRVVWIGLKPSSWDVSQINRDDLLLLGDRDRKKAIAMAKRTSFPIEWRRELEYMLHLNRKAEIEIIASSTSTASPCVFDISHEHSGLVNYVASQILDAL